MPAFEILTIDPNTLSLTPLSSSIFPSIPSPHVELADVQVTVHSGAENYYKGLAEIKVSGRVFCNICDFLENGVITEVGIVLNHQEVARCDLRVLKAKSENGSRPYPYCGEFNTTLGNVTLRNDLNVLKVIAKSPVYDLDGFDECLIRIQTPYYDGPEEEPKIIQPPALSELPRLSRCGGSGEFYPLLIATTKKNVTKSKVGGETVEFKEAMFSEGKKIAHRNSVPMVMTLRPTCKSINTEPGPRKLNRKFRSSNFKSSFLASFWHGCFATGIDLVNLEDASSIELLPKNLGGFTLTVGKTKIPLSAKPTDDFRNSDNTIRHLLYRAVVGTSSDQKGSAYPILNELPDGDWRDFLMTMLTLLNTELLKESSKVQPAVSGYAFGRIIGEGLKRCLNKDYPVKFERAELKKAGRTMTKLTKDILKEPLFSKR